MKTKIKTDIASLQENIFKRQLEIKYQQLNDELEWMRLVYTEKKIKDVVVETKSKHKPAWWRI